jgi:hypothetical protein
MRDYGMTPVQIAAALRKSYGLGGLAAARQAHGWSQVQAAEEWTKRWPDEPIGQKALSGWECWPASGRTPSLRTIARLAELYQVAASDLLTGWADFRRPADRERSSAELQSTVLNGRAFGTGVDDRDMCPTLSLPAPRARVGALEIGDLRRELDSLYLTDNRRGGTAVFPQAVGLLRHIRDTLDRATYGNVVACQLHGLAGRLAELAGRCAYDAGQVIEGRRLLTEAVVSARLAEDDPLRISVFMWLARYAAAYGEGRQAVELTEAATRIAGRSTSPRLRSLLYLVQAMGLAVLQDGPACHRLLARAADAMAEDGDTDHESWLDFAGEDVLHGGSAEAFLSLGLPNAAEHAARAAVAANDQCAFPKHRGLYLGRLATALAARGELDESAAVTVEALDGVRTGRLVTQLLALRPVFETNRRVPGVKAALEALATA